MGKTILKILKTLRNLESIAEDKVFSEEEINEELENISEINEIFEDFDRIITNFNKIDIDGNKLLIDDQLLEKQLFELHVFLGDIEWQYDQIQQMIIKLIKSIKCTEV